MTRWRNHAEGDVNGAHSVGKRGLKAECREVPATVKLGSQACRACPKRMCGFGLLRAQRPADEVFQAW